MQHLLVEGSTDSDTPSLFYNDKCRICTGLANKIRAYSKGRITVLSIYDDEAAVVLGGLLGIGFPKNFYLVKQSGDPKRGYRAVVGLTDYVGIINSAKLVFQLLYYELRYTVGHALKRRLGAGGTTTTPRLENA